MTVLFYNIIEKSLTFSFIIAILYCLMCVKKKNFTSKCRYNLWILIIIALAIPVGTLPNTSLFTITMPISQKNGINTKDSPTSVITADSVSNEISVSDKNDQVQNQQASILTGVTNEVNLSNVSNSLTPPKETTPNINSYEINWQLILSYISLIWLIGVVLYFLWHTIIYFRYTIKFKKNLVPAGCDAQEIFSQVCSNNKITRAPKLCISNNISCPMLFGIFSSTIIIPDNLENTDALNGILAHELTHYKRRDLWIKLLILFNVSIHWFNPLVHLAAKHCNNEMELSCDEYVLKNYSNEARISYGNMMLSIVKNCHREHIVLTTHFNPKSNSIKERFENILDNKHKRSGKKLILLIFLLCIIANMLIACKIVKQTANYAEKESVSEDESVSKNEPQTSVVVNESIQTEESNEGYIIPTGGAGTLQIFQSNFGGPLIVQSEDLSENLAKVYSKIGDYKCKTSGATYLCGDNPFLIKDDGYYLYNYVTGERKEYIIPDGIYNSFHPIHEQNTGKWIGLSVRNGDKCAFYSFETQSFKTDFSYSSIGLASAHGYVCVRMDLLGNVDNILDINTGLILYSFDKKNYYDCRVSFLYNDNYFYFMVRSVNNYKYTYCLYNENFKLAKGSEDNGYTQIALSDEGYLIVIDKDDTHFKCYNKNGINVKPMNTYKKVLYIKGNYAWVIDLDNYLKLINIDGDVLATFTEWNDNLRFQLDLLLASYNESIDGSHLLIEDLSIPDYTNGRGKDFYYNPETGESGMIPKVVVGSI